MLPTAQFLALSGDISALFPAWLSIKSRVGRRGGVKRKFQHALAGSLPRTSPSALPALPRTPGPHLQLPPSLEGVLSSWGPLAGAQGLLPSPHSRYCRAGQSEEVPGQFVHSFTYSFIQSHALGTHPHTWPRCRWYWRHSDETTLSHGLQSRGVQIRHQGMNGNLVWSGLA